MTEERNELTVDQAMNDMLDKIIDEKPIDKSVPNDFMVQQGIVPEVDPLTPPDKRPKAPATPESHIEKPEEPSEEVTDEEIREVIGEIEKETDESVVEDKVPFKNRMIELQRKTDKLVEEKLTSFKNEILETLKNLQHPVQEVQEQKVPEHVLDTYRMLKEKDPELAAEYEQRYYASVQREQEPSYVKGLKEQISKIESALNIQAKAAEEHQKVAWDNYMEQQRQSVRQTAVAAGITSKEFIDDILELSESTYYRTAQTSPESTLEGIAKQKIARYQKAVAGSAKGLYDKKAQQAAQSSKPVPGKGNVAARTAYEDGELNLNDSTSVARDWQKWLVDKQTP